jgi:hypothetical protein
MILFAIYMVLVTGCSSAPKEKPSSDNIITPTAVANTPVSLTSGPIETGVKLVYDDKGVWTKILSTATAPSYVGTREAVDVAIIVAEAKARRQMAEFVKTDLTSRKVILATTKNGHTEESDIDSHSREVQDRITQISGAILRGTVIESSDFDANTYTVKVVVKADRKSFETSTAVKGGSL